MIDIDKQLLERLKGFSREQHNELMSAFNISGREPSVQISLALFRDALVFREMAQSTIYMMRREIEELKSRVETLEDKEMLE